MKPNHEREGERWLRQAERDLDDARFADEGRRFHLACFLSQQAAEKAIKAFLYARGEEDVWGHSVGELCRQAVSYSREFEVLGKRIAVLDKYYIPTRYPNGLPGGIPSEAFDAEDAKRAILLADEGIAFVRGQMNQPEP
jgi:HEPN domain-containing protein